ncbi:hypothetical protein [Subsaximicrobium wynnwilliamsii]|uniref:hypothetical protein n=1 Tax=Subsaximicrobium wynnwilliamsii TaxID=291179 RepID=UPI001CB8A4C7|nr:hypothetical protein [Subsaximicrobium wynnwilliamsii]
MKTKPYIAALLAFLFLAKFIAIDANGLNALFSGSDITFVNPHCKKEKLANLSEKTANLSQTDQLDSRVINLDGFCSAQFQFELFTWETDCPKPKAVFNEHFSSRLSFLYLENASPPPRLA